MRLPQPMMPIDLGSFRAATLIRRCRGRSRVSSATTVIVARATAFHLLFKGVDNGRDVVPHHSIVRAPIAITQTVGVECPANLGSCFLGNFR